MHLSIYLRLYKIAPVVLAVIVAATASGSGDAAPVGRPAGPSAPQAGIALEQRFIANGTVLVVHPPVKGMQRFVMHVGSVRPAAGYPDGGRAYAGKEVEVLSHGPLPASVRVNAKLSVVLRLVGDEWHQKLFLVEVMEHEQHN